MHTDKQQLSLLYYVNVKNLEIFYLMNLEIRLLHQNYTY